MKNQYNHKQIESKWQKEWEKKGVYKAADKSKKKKFYALVEFPYPSGEGLHVGHPRPYIGLDLVARKRRMEGYNVLYPMGWDAFGLPTENYAIKTGAQPEAVTKKNINNFRRQIKLLGTSFDWSREVNTTDPKYYKWTQWLFLQFLKHDLAYKAKISINWCPKDKIGLANEEVINGKCERCGTLVEKREKEQWMLRITKYADRLDKDLDKVDYLEKIKLQQRNWIGRSEGTEISFELRAKSLEHENLKAPSSKLSAIKVFTTRADTLFGATYLVVAPEHPLVWSLREKIQNWDETSAYREEVKKKSEIERTAEDKDPSTGSGLAKTGVELKGIKAINPANGEEIPVFIADYVLGNYGTGAVMAVPAHDERDYAFAKKYGLPIIEVIEPLITKETGEDAFESSKPVSERRSVVAVIKHWSEDKYLGAIWKRTGWQGFVIGGIEDGEDGKTAGLREITEETGYKNVEFVKALPGIINARFFQRVKNQNRLAHFEPMLFKLKDGEMTEVAEEEKALQDLKWLRPEEFEKFITHADMQIVWQRAMGNYCYTGDGEMVLGCSRKGILTNSGEFNGLESEEARKKITEKFGKKVVKYKLRDWVFSRQRYWGEPIPVVYCPHCAEASRGKENAGWVPLPEKDLPLRLPKVKNYQPTDTGESPLAGISKWVNTKCPKCGGKAKRETDTMPNWAGSSWYFLRYTDPRNDKKFADPKKLKYWMPVDWYNGGMEHTTLHLLYSRFWNKFLYDIGLVPVSEPYKKRTSHGFILASNGEKMSKSRGNVINPDEVIQLHGADTFRLYEMFMGPFDQMISWSDNNIIGVRRFVERVWKLKSKCSPEGKKQPADTEQNKKLEQMLHKTIKKVGEDIEAMSFNTAVSDMMILANEMEKMPEIPKSYFEKFLAIMSPFAPHITEELWHMLGHKTLLVTEKWPAFDKSKIKESKATIVVQVSGKMRAQFEAKAGISEAEAREKAILMPDVQKWLAEKEVKKVIFVPNKIINFVI